MLVFMKFTLKIVRNILILAYNVSSFNGKKFIVFSTTNAFGGKNEFLSIAYICVGVVCCVVTLGFLIRKFLSKVD